MMKVRTEVQVDKSYIECSLKLGGRLAVGVMFNESARTVETSCNAAISLTEFA